MFSCRCLVAKAATSLGFHVADALSRDNICLLLKVSNHNEARGSGHRGDYSTSYLVFRESPRETQYAFRYWGLTFENDGSGLVPRRLGPAKSGTVVTSEFRRT
ncbi:hypothetical protein F5144DRAFT_90693 [Chaetomium tenue]|uniref:Uncharacterized protein n=1 Tax=Chaetomium tenue TaxID=1854479 RepID=A0ACB7PI05_9PEZI|nr:hypothetical protein F5144DRAFT_90693 [Chaetomium globosum]